MPKRTLRVFDDLEDLVNKSLGLRDTKGSGSVHGDGDGRTRCADVLPVLAECKFTEKPGGSISVRKKDMEKTVKAARRYGTIPIMVRGDIHGNAHVVLDLDDFAFLYKLARKI